MKLASKTPMPGEVASAWTVRRPKIYWFARFGPNAANIVHRQDVVRVRWARIKWTRRQDAQKHFRSESL